MTAAPRLTPGPILLAVAAPAEARAVLAGLGTGIAAADAPWELHQLSERLHLVVTGIGKSNAAGCVARVLDPDLHAGVISIGVAGALPGRSAEPVPLRTTLLGTTSVFADEGLQTDTGFQDCAALGFPLAPPPVAGPIIPAHPAMLAPLREVAGATGPIATVSTCSGTDALARQVEERTGAVAEAMEGAAVGLVAARLGVPFAELRIISNTTGQRDRQHWDLPGALAALGRAATAIARIVP